MIAIGSHPTLSLTKEAQKWAQSFVKNEKSLQGALEKLKTFTELQKNQISNQNQNQSRISTIPRNFSNSVLKTGGKNLAKEIEDLKEMIRKGETSLLKAEARLELFRESGILNVEELLATAQTNVDVLSQSGGSSMSRRSSQLSLPSMVKIFAEYKKCTSTV